MPSNYQQICHENLEEYGKGTRHLAFLERLYTERTHFVFELLQNAEDATATSVQFNLYRDRLEVLHDGLRLFNEKDVRGVCGIAEGTKAEDLTQIGKFGIGFKSIYAFTERPEVHSGDEHFAIEKYIRPHAVTPRDIQAPWTTLFILPFSRADISQEVALDEIGKRLANLGPRTMLFLRNIQKIEWTTQDGPNGCYEREEKRKGPARLVIVKVMGGDHETKEREAWLVFEAPVASKETSAPLRVEAAFHVGYNEKTDAEEIRPVNQAVLSVFFPTEKPTGLGFLIQGPYRTTPARDNVPKDDHWNRQLVASTAKLVSQTLVQLRDINLLTSSTFRALPLRESDFPSETLFRPIFDAVADTLKTEPLIPCDSGIHVSATKARLSRPAELRKLFPSEILKSLFHSVEPLDWVTGEITPDRTPEIYTYFRHTLQVEELSPEGIARRLDRRFLESASDEWLREFYIFLDDKDSLWRKPRWISNTWSSDPAGPLRSMPIIRLESGEHTVPFQPDDSPNAYLTAPVQRCDIPLVKHHFVEDQRTRSFLQKLGLGEFDVLAEIRDRVIPKYRRSDETVTVEENLRDLHLITQVLFADSSSKKGALRTLLRDVPFLRGRNAAASEESYRRPCELYFTSTDLEMFFGGNPDAWFLASVYLQEHEVAIEELGVSRTIRLIEPEREADWQGKILADEWGQHRRGLEGFDPEFDVDGLKHALESPIDKRSLYVWDNIATPFCNRISGIVESSTRQDFSRSGKKVVPSKMGKLLRNSAWLPFNGGFVKPGALAMEDLPETFCRNESLASRLEMKANDVASLAKKVGLEAADIEQLKTLKEDPALYQEFRQWLHSKMKKPEFPVRKSSDPGRRVQRSQEEARNAPKKEYQEGERSVRTSAPGLDPSSWLREMYTNEHGQMICQLCQSEMPFKKRDGQYYFEAIEVSNAWSIEHPALHIALCPVCAAKYKEFIKNDPSAVQRVEALLLESEQPILPLTLGSTTASLQFVERHFIDLRAIVEVEHPRT